MSRLENLELCSNKALKPLYVFSHQLQEKLVALDMFQERSLLVPALIEAYGLLSRVSLLTPVPATEEELRSFHSEDFVQALKSSGQLDPEEHHEELEAFGLGFDCPLLPDLFGLACWLAGGTLSAARALRQGSTLTAINWAGGWHHAKRDQAAGFCYVNDIVLGILELLKTFQKVLYLDFDLHHGDGVEEAFSSTSKVLCFSVHRFGCGFYPGTGALEEVGFGRGKHFTLNLPLEDGIRDQPYLNMVGSLLEDIYATFSPDCVVVQFGADGLMGDPIDSSNGFNLTLAALGGCLEKVLQWKKPTLLLGGGGYHPANVARCWTYLTSLTCGQSLINEIPDHKFLMHYGPDYQLCILPGNRPDCNTSAHLNRIIATIQYYLEEIQKAVFRHS